MGTCTESLTPEQRQRLAVFGAVRATVGLLEPLDVWDQIRVAHWVATGQELDELGLQVGEKIVLGPDAATWSASTAAAI